MVLLYFLQKIRDTSQCVADLELIDQAEAMSQCVADLELIDRAEAIQVK